jgi:hypothetical protein
VPQRVWVNGDIPSGTDFNNLFADPLQADVATNQTTTNVAYVDLATVGPAVTLNMVNGQRAEVTVSAFCSNVDDGAISFMSFAVSGAWTLAANDTNAAKYLAIKTFTSTGQMVERTTIVAATATGSVTFTCKYKSDGTFLQHWDTRRIIVRTY